VRAVIPEPPTPRVIIDHVQDLVAVRKTANVSRQSIFTKKLDELDFDLWNSCTKLPSVSRLIQMALRSHYCYVLSLLTRLTESRVLPTARIGPETLPIKTLFEASCSASGRGK
jgi:hypothetical protein